MSSHSYPHMVFVLSDSGLDKDTLAAWLREVFPAGEVTDKPLRLDLEVDGYTFSFWFEEAEGVAEHYATYLPENSSRRWLTRCTALIDLHGVVDPEGAHAATAERLVAALQGHDGVEVFSEKSRRFLGMDYGDTATNAPVASPADDETSAEAVAQPAESPAPVLEPVAAATVPAKEDPTTVWMEATPSLDSSCPEEDLTPTPEAVPEPAMVTPEPTVPVTAPEPAAPAPAETPAIPAAEPEGSENPSEPSGKPGLLRRLFGRR
ncbi:hypothetical protein SAMN05421595_1940 [Austwickia chelonae]|uniref:Uncharacterized protein n=1 Tax=Austwickia chelonae NBRC 105200 TaxID=1184607 RepID=K6UKZ3_9MICO|nr:hypothetical protein [Austwickia chelonae]GAB76806.1 hypothetical protein AUCHE_03_00230 [Austwickia chelonae NBRC 105200]SEW30957.1 hypothetical protein SAMN05421595_1940 [Austwickia chelonae]